MIHLIKLAIWLVCFIVGITITTAVYIIDLAVELFHLPSDVWELVEEHYDDT
jgi:hypothetical protein